MLVQVLMLKLVLIPMLALILIQVLMLMLTLMLMLNWCTKEDGGRWSLDWSSSWLSLFDRASTWWWWLWSRCQCFDPSPNIFNHESGIKGTNQWLQWFDNEPSLALSMAPLTVLAAHSHKIYPTNGISGCTLVTGQKTSNAHESLSEISFVLLYSLKPH